jgi:hypothetical protein
VKTIASDDVEILMDVILGKKEFFNIQICSGTLSFLKHGAKEETTDLYIEKMEFDLDQNLLYLFFPSS